jgi:hypothetical protein
LTPPTWLATIVHAPNVTKVTVPLLVTVHTLGVLDTYVTGNPELAVAPMLNDAAVLGRSAGSAKVMVCIVRIINDCVTGVATA